MASRKAQPPDGERKNNRVPKGRRTFVGFIPQNIRRPFGTRLM
ncbi:MAG TPA: hypothetical protein VF779_04990 [Pyrinomonadaceae bacterium]